MGYARRLTTWRPGDADLQDAPPPVSRTHSPHRVLQLAASLWNGYLDVHQLVGRETSEVDWHVVLRVVSRPGVDETFTEPGSRPRRPDLHFSPGQRCPTAFVHDTD